MAAGDVITIIEDSVSRKGVVFDGTDDYILVDAHAVERVAANDTVGTYTAWVFNTSDAASTQCFLSAGDNDVVEFLALNIYRAAAGNLGGFRVRLQQGGAPQFEVRQKTASIPLNEWTHLALVQNGTQPALYVNGVAIETTNETATQLSAWYDELTGCDKFALGVKEANGTHTDDYTGAIGQVKYWSRALSAAEILKDYNGESVDCGDYPNITYLRLNITMENDGTTDSGAGADNGTLTGNAHYGGYISAHSMALERNCTGHAAERSTTMQISPSKLQTIIVRGD
jgi:hypothetical protein